MGNFWRQNSGSSGRAIFTNCSCPCPEYVKCFQFSCRTRQWNTRYWTFSEEKICSCSFLRTKLEKPRQIERKTFLTYHTRWGQASCRLVSTAHFQALAERFWSYLQKGSDLSVIVPTFQPGSAGPAGTAGKGIQLFLILIHKSRYHAIFQ